MNAAQIFKTLSKRYSSPRSVQILLRSLSYNREKHGETVRSAYACWKKRQIHCLEASLLAAAILEHRGYPPLVMSLESKDNLDHVIFVFKRKSGWGSVGRSREEGLHGRAPRFRSLRDLAQSYFDPFIDKTGRLKAYGLANLDDWGVHWRYSSRNLWSLEQFLCDLKHKKIPRQNKRYKRLLAEFFKTGMTKETDQNWW